MPPSSISFVFSLGADRFLLRGQSCLKTWLGKTENVKAAQEALLARARANSLANLGKYKAGMEKSLDKAGTFEAGYKY